MVLAAARRSKPEKFKPADKYTLNKGHVKFFYDKREWLEERYAKLIAELRRRNYQIDPDSRSVDFSSLDKFPQNQWVPDSNARQVNRKRLAERIADKPHWYRHYGIPLETQ